MFAIDNTTIIGIDIQEKLVQASYTDEPIKKILKLLKAATILDVDTILTEQYPKGLGSTIPEVKSAGDFDIINKTSFSVVQNEKIKQKFLECNNENVIIFGSETHICVLQTAIDLIREDCNVFIVADCCFSRSEFDHKTALNLLRQHGAYIVTLETVLFDFVKSSKHPNFKEIQALVK